MQIKGSLLLNPSSPSVLPITRREGRMGGAAALQDGQQGRRTPALLELAPGAARRAHPSGRGDRSSLVAVRMELAR
jgi:hypothetical protein